MSTSHPNARVESSDNGPVVFLNGDWTTDALEHVDEVLRSLKLPDEARLRVDARNIEHLDTSGALRIRQLLLDLEARDLEVSFEGLSQKYQELLGFVWSRCDNLGTVVDAPYQTFVERIGQDVFDRVEESGSLLSFLGEATVTAFQGVIRPFSIRWRTVLGVIQSAGVQALPIIGLLSFLLGVVIAYQGGVQLQLYGANIFIVELVSVTMVRELGPLITAIIVAGRTGSAFTAEIGTMKVTEEIDAMRTIGMGPMGVLVLPKVLGLMIVLPLLTVFSCAMGVFGGMVMAEVVLDVSLVDFWKRIPDAVSFSSYAAGIGKAPAFAAIIALVGCFQGTRVSGGAESVGQKTTISVVQSIFLVIVADAGFSIIFSLTGV